MKNKDIERHYQLDQLLDAMYYLRDDPNDESLKNLAIHRREQIIKSLKALEIIKEKNVDIVELKRSVDLQWYNLNHFTTSKDLLSKEFDLLKEVLK